MMKRNRSSEGDNSITVQLANCLMLLSSSRDSSMISNRVFTCKTCERQFTSFQALGGHRASHKKPRLTVVAGGGDQPPPPSSPAKQKIHECSVCGLEFPIGQALGGHMRRHRSSAINITNNNNNNNNNVVDDDHDPIKQLIMSRTFLSLSPPPDVKKLMPNNMRRSALCLDLNLTPLENKFVFGRLVRAPSHVDFI